MVRPPRYNDLLAVFLKVESGKPGQKSPPGSGVESSALFYLLHLRSIVLIQPKDLDGKHLTLLVRSFPSIGEAARRNCMFASHEGKFDFV